MPRVLFRLRAAQPSVDQHSGGEGIRPRIRRGGNSEASFSHTRAQFVAAIRSSCKSSPVISDCYVVQSSTVFCGTFTSASRLIFIRYRGNIDVKRPYNP